MLKHASMTMINVTTISCRNLKTTNVHKKKIPVERHRTKKFHDLTNYLWLNVLTLFTFNVTSSFNQIFSIEVLKRSRWKWFYCDFRRAAVKTHPALTTGSITTIYFLYMHVVVLTSILSIFKSIYHMFSISHERTFKIRYQCVDDIATAK